MWTDVFVLLLDTLRYQCSKRGVYMRIKMDFSSV